MLRDLTTDERGRLSAITAGLKADAAALAVERHAAALIAKGMPEAEARAQAAGRASGGWSTRGDHPVEVVDDPHAELQLEDGSAITMVEWLRDVALYAGTQCADPAEPDYRGDGRVAVLCENGTIFSHAHGGIIYRPSGRVQAGADWGDLDDENNASGSPIAEVARPANDGLAAGVATGAGAAHATQATPAAEPEQPGSVESRKPPAWLAVPVDDLDTAELPPQPWHWEGLIPSGELTLLGAHGGTGKSQVALMLSVSAAVGRPLFGVPVAASPVVFFSAEDNAETVRRRLQSVMRAMGVRAADVAQRLTLLDASAGAPELAAPKWGDDGQQRLHITRMGADLRAFMAQHPRALLIVDNASDTMGGDEINRRDVRAFVRLLVGMVRDTGGAVLLLAHVNRDTARGGGVGRDTEGYSGSTAWHNSARSRLFLKRNKDTSGLTLEHQKSNFGPLREPLQLVWPEGGLPTLDDVAQHGAQAAGVDPTRALLGLIAEFTVRGEFIATATTSPANAAKVLALGDGFPTRMPRAQVFECLRDAERRGWLERVQYRSPDRKPRERWQVTPAGAAEVGIAGFAPPAPSAPTP